MQDAPRSSRGQRLRGLDPALGAFRSFVVVSVRNFVNNERDRKATRKRGGDRVIESLDTLVAERRLADEPSLAADAERYELLGPLLAGDGTTLPYQEIASRLELSEAGVKSVVHRMRKRFGVLLRGEVMQTVDRSEDVDGEIRHLLRALSGAS